MSHNRPPTRYPSAEFLPLRWEQFGLLSVVCLYLIIFNVEIPHGDALRISRQIEANSLILNPNHLLLDWFGHVWTNILQQLGLSISILGGFELISAIATLISLYLFHHVLILLGVRQASIRLIVTLGLFASKNFLSMAISQYFFMLQMPFLLGAFIFAIRSQAEADKIGIIKFHLCGTGVLLAIAACIEINNIVPLFFAGLALAKQQGCVERWQFSNTINVWGAAAIIGLPIYFVAYILSDPDSSFFAWVLSYAGQTDSSLDNYYGTRASLQGLASSTATVSFHFLFGNVIETAGLGTVLKVLVTNEPMEFVPNTLNIVLASVLMPIVGISIAGLCAWVIFRAWQDPVVRLSSVFVVSYLIFNLFWPYSSDLFWFQMLPFIWIVLAIYLVGSTASEISNKRDNLTMQSPRVMFLTVVVACLFGLNTHQTVIPIARANLDENQTLHNVLVEQFSLEIVPGWDNYKWMMRDNQNDSMRKLVLMNMALLPDDDPGHISRLPATVTLYLKQNKRVAVGRLFALDRESNPWYGLADVGWSRHRIQELFSEFCLRPLGTIDDVEFHEVTFCHEIKDIVESRHKPSN